MAAPSRSIPPGARSVSVPTPESWATSVGVRRSMLANRRVDTRPERALRSRLHASGLRFRKDFRIKLDAFSVRVDVVFPAAKLAVFVDGCFWHQCPEHATTPKRNSEFWIPKLRRNVERDQHVNRALTEAGWTVIRCWEHENPTDVLPRVVSALEAAR
jgi:DNA mismatch endonuclease, patch repair protein